MSREASGGGRVRRALRRGRSTAPSRRRWRGRRPPVVPWRMIGFLLGLGVLAGFAAVNVEHRADVSLGFFAFSQVPVFLSLLVAFIAGALFVLPLAMRRGRRMRDAELANAPIEGQVRAAVASRASRRRLRSPEGHADLTDDSNEVGSGAGEEDGEPRAVASEDPALALPGRARRRPSSNRKRRATGASGRRDSSAADAK